MHGVYVCQFHLIFALLDDDTKQIALRAASPVLHRASQSLVASAEPLAGGSGLSKGSAASKGSV